MIPAARMSWSGWQAWKFWDLASPTHRIKKFVPFFSLMHDKRKQNFRVLWTYRIDNCKPLILLLICMHALCTARLLSPKPIWCPQCPALLNVSISTGMFYWLNSVQPYNSGGWNYITELKLNHKRDKKGIFGIGLCRYLSRKFKKIPWRVRPLEDSRGQVCKTSRAQGKAHNKSFLLVAATMWLSSYKFHAVLTG